MKRSFLTLLVSLFLTSTVSASINISSYNIRNFDKPGQGTNKTLLKEIISDLNADLIATQEIYNNQSFEKFVDKNFKSYKLTLSKCGGGGSQNIGFMFKDSVLKLDKVIEDSKIAELDGITSFGCSSLRPALVGFFTIKATGESFVAVSLHLKAGGGSRNYSKRKKQYRYILKMIRGLRSSGYKNIIVLGDMNTTGWNLKDEDFKNFDNLLYKSGTTTISEKLRCTSYWSGENQNDDIEHPSVLDHIFHTKNFLGLKLRKASVSAHCKRANCQQTYDSVLGMSYESVSDHCPISASFR